MLRRLIGVASVTVVLAAPAHGYGRPFPHFAAGCSRADFRSAGVDIRAERCGASSGRRAVVVLHGCGGFSTFDHRIAVDLPRFGITTLYVDYFARTPPPGTRGFCSLWRDDRQLFNIWEQVAVDGAASLRTRFAHVGAVGWSLGAGVAIAAAEDHPYAFGALAAFSALAYPAVLRHAGSLPPSIFLSGGSRDIVTPANARRLAAAARSAHVRSVLFIYPNGTHSWPGEQGAVGRSRAARFLLRFL